MMTPFVRRTLAAALAVCGSATFAQTAADHTLGQHPAVLVKRQPVRIDPNRFIPAHPAGLYVISAPSATYAHPAVAVKRMAEQAAADAATPPGPLAAAAAAGATH